MADLSRTALFTFLTPEKSPLQASSSLYLANSLAFRRTTLEFLRLLSFNVIQAIGVS